MKNPFTYIHWNIKKNKHKQMELKEQKINEENVQTGAADTQQVNPQDENLAHAATDESAQAQAEGTGAQDQEEVAEGQEVAVENVEALLQAELEKTRQALEEQRDKYLRLSAEFDNYRKRTMKEKAELILNGGEKCISSILPIIDDMERAIKTMQQATDVAAVREGVELIYNKFMNVLGKNGVKVIETQEKPLDTDFHEAIAVIPAPATELKGKILDCVQTGYMLNEKVIRHAKVVVGE